MANVTVSPHGQGTYVVEVRTDEAQTTHVVSVPPGLNVSVGCQDVEEAELVRASFEFLLDREPPSSILRRFSLEVIGSYFPEYRTEIGRMVTRQVPGKKPEG
jgi:hypothetical protein